MQHLPHILKAHAPRLRQHRRMEGTTPKAQAKKRGPEVTQNGAPSSFGTKGGRSDELLRAGRPGPAGRADAPRGRKITKKIFFAMEQIRAHIRDGRANGPRIAFFSAQKTPVALPNDENFPGAPRRRPRGPDVGAGRGAGCRRKIRFLGSLKITKKLFCDGADLSSYS